MTHELIGQIVKLDKIPYRRVYSPIALADGKVLPEEIIEGFSYKLNDPEMVVKIKEMLGESVRILPPGTMKTADYKPYRKNVYLDETGKITDVRNG